MLKTPIIAILVALTGAVSAFGQPTTAPSGADAEVVTRVYEITDLLMQKRDYPAPVRNETKPNSTGGTLGLLDGPAPTSQPAPADMTSAIISLIEETIASDTWRDNGGTVGNIRLLNDEMIIMQTAENHRLIAKLL